MHPPPVTVYFFLSMKLQLQQKNHFLNFEACLTFYLKGCNRRYDNLRLHTLTTEPKTQMHERQLAFIACESVKQSSHVAFWAPPSPHLPNGGVSWSEEGQSTEQGNLENEGASSPCNARYNPDARGLGGHVVHQCYKLLSEWGCLVRLGHFS